MKETLCIIILLTLLALPSFYGTAQTFDKKGINNYVKTEMQTEKIPGLAYAVVMNGKIIDTGAYGLANVELHSPVTLHTKFAVGSIGKTFTATAVMLLVKEGKLHLEDPITMYLDSLPDSWKAITIRRLLSHTSGIKDYVEDFPGYSLIEKASRQKEYTESEYIHMASELPLNFSPGEKWAYSNSNFVLLGFIVHKVSGKTLPEFMKEYVFGPLGMKETVYMTQTDIILNRAHGYTLNNKGDLINGSYISDFFSSTGDIGVTTTVIDMAKWSLALDSGKVLDKTTLSEMWSPSVLNNGASIDYGLGWRLSIYRGHKECGHGGYFKNGYAASYFRYPEYNLSVVILTNQHHADVRTLWHSFAGFYVPALTPVNRMKPVADGDTSLVKEANLLIREIKTNSLDTSLVTQGFKERLDSTVQSAIANDTTRFTITYISSDLFANNLTVHGVPVEKISYFKVHFETREDVYFSLYLTAGKKISDWVFY